VYALSEKSCAGGGEVANYTKNANICMMVCIVRPDGRSFVAWGEKEATKIFMNRSTGTGICDNMQKE
jgi:hypothetical protein